MRPVHQTWVELQSDITSQSYTKGQYMLSKCNLYVILKDATVLQPRIYSGIAFHILAA